MIRISPTRGLALAASWTCEKSAMPRLLDFVPVQEEEQCQEDDDGHQGGDDDGRDEPVGVGRGLRLDVGLGAGGVRLGLGDDGEAEHLGHLRVLHVAERLDGGLRGDQAIFWNIDMALLTGSGRESG